MIHHAPNVQEVQPIVQIVATTEICLETESVSPAKTGKVLIVNLVVILKTAILV